MKICVLGNSHAGALKRAWDNICSDYPDIQIFFFAGRSIALSDMRVEGDVLVPGNERLKKAIEFTSGGRGHIDPAEYDVFLIYGLAEPNFIEQRPVYFSKQARELALSDLCTSTASFHLITNLRKLTGKRIYVGHVPLLAATEPISEKKPEEYVNGVQLLNERFYGPLNAKLVLQPAETIVNGKKTHPEFSKDSKRLAIGDRYDDELHPSDDTGHMNDAFGEAWLRAFLKEVTK